MKFNFISSCTLLHSVWPNPIIVFIVLPQNGVIAVVTAAGIASAATA